jgi:hypothetical protein
MMAAQGVAMAAPTEDGRKEGIGAEEAVEFRLEK